MKLENVSVLWVPLDSAYHVMPKFGEDIVTISLKQHCPPGDAADELRNVAAYMDDYLVCEDY